MKKLNKLFAILVAMAMVLSLSVVSAFAAQTIEDGAGPTATKKLIVPKDAVIPSTATTTIYTTLKTIDGVTTTDTSKNVEITIPLSTLSGDHYVGKTTSGQNEIYYYETGDLLGGKAFTGGTYIFDVKEKDYDIAADTETVVNHETSDPTTYTMKVYVGNDGKVKKVTVYDGETKKDVIKEIPADDTATAEANGVKFTNKWYQELKSNSFETAPFGLKKVVELTDGLGDQNTPFTMNVAVELPAETGAASATYVITDKDGNQKSTGTLDATTTSVANLALAHNESIYFTSIPVGSKVTATETDPRAEANGSYTKTYSVDVNGETLKADSHLNTTVTNKYKTVEDTGVLVSNLPYIVLALVAIGGMVAYVVVRRRNTDEA